LEGAAERLSMRSTAWRDRLVQLDQAIGRRERILRALELVCALVILGLCLRWFAPLLRDMASSSLWNDELYTINQFSSRGPLHVVTDYHVPNNHVFFNLVNALTPNSASVLPLRARLWSMLSVGAAGLSLLGHFWRRGRFVEGAIGACTMLAVEQLDDLTLQARGYGFVCLAAVVLSLAVTRLAETDDRRELAVIAVASVLGSYTMPTFVFFAGLVLLVLWAQRRTRAEFLCGVATGLGVALVYAPLVKQLVAQVGSYASEWGESYAELSAVQETLSEFFWAGIKPWGVLLLVLASTLLPAYVREPAVAKSARVLSGAVWLTFCLFLAQRTPLIRTTCFVVAPLGFALIAAGSAFVRQGGHILTSLAHIAAAASACLILVPRIQGYEFIPIETWLEVARYVEQHFPKGTRVAVPFRGHYLDAYLDDAYPVDRELDPARFAAGEQLFVDGDFRSKKTFDGHAYAEGPECAEFPQRRGGKQVLWWVPKL
jgi:hypothetical protein